jgi:outer membrane receptor for ferrienterochelin and colicins
MHHALQIFDTFEQITMSPFMETRFLFFFCLAAYVVFGQNPTRTVEICFFESEKIPIPGVLIVSGSSGIAPAETGTDGCASLQIPPGQHVLTCQLMGYQTKTIPVSYDQIPATGQKLKFQMVPQFQKLQTVVVSVGKFEQRVEETTVSLDIIEPYLIQSRNPLDIRSTFDQSPGVNVTDGQANIRGGSGWSYGAGSRVLVMVDDMPMISADANQVVWSLIPFEALRQMEVIKGASSALYGTTALNGVVNIRTLDATDIPKLNLNVFQGAYQPPSRFAIDQRLRGVSGMHFSYAEKIDRLKLVLSGNMLNDDGFAFNQYERRGRLHAKLDYEIPNVPGLEVGLTANVMNRANSEALLWQSNTQPYIPLDSGATLTEGWDFYIDPRISYRRRNHKHSYKGRYLEVNNNARSPTQNFENYSTLQYHEYQFQQFFNKGPVLTAGAVAAFGNSESELFRGVYATENYAAYGQVDYTWRWLSTSAGVRYEYFSIDDARTYQRPVFRAGANAALGKASFLRASWGQGYRFPSIAELFTFTNVGNIFVYPSPDLQPESGFSAEIGFKQGVKWGENWNGFLDFAAYTMEYDNMMEFSFGQWQASSASDFGIGFRSINVGPTRISGAEITLTGAGRIGGLDVRFLGGYNYSLPVALDPDGVYAESINGNPVSYRNSSSSPENNILKYRYQHLAKGDIQAEYKRWMFGLSLRYNSFMQNIDEIFEGSLIDILLPGVGIRESRLEVANGDYIWDIRAGYRVTDELQMSIIGNNLTNRIYFPRPAMIGPPRMLMVQVHYGF